MTLNTVMHRTLTLALEQLSNRELKRLLFEIKRDREEQEKHYSQIVETAYTSCLGDEKEIKRDIVIMAALANYTYFYPDIFVTRIDPTQVNEHVVNQIAEYLRNIINEPEKAPISAMAI